VTCEEYIASFLSAHADGELSPEELRAANDHLEGGAGGCASCRARLAEERLLRSLIHQHGGADHLPPLMRARLDEALDRLDAESAPAAFEADDPGRRPSVTPRRRAWRFAAPLAAAAALALVLWRHGMLPLGSPPEMTTLAPAAVIVTAVDHFARFERGFTPNVPSTSPESVASAYAAARMPTGLWDFTSAHYTMVGGRLDHLPDGKPVAYTFYLGADGDEMLCAYYKSYDRDFPPGAVGGSGNYRYYRRGATTIRVETVAGHPIICVLVSNMPLDEMRHDVSIAAMLPPAS